jgi:hypothetical protein
MVLKGEQQEEARNMFEGRLTAIRVGDLADDVQG